MILYVRRTNCKHYSICAVLCYENVLVSCSTWLSESSTPLLNYCNVTLISLLNDPLARLTHFIQTWYKVSQILCQPFSRSPPIESSSSNRLACHVYDTQVLIPNCLIAVLSMIHGVMLETRHAEGSWAVMNVMPSIHWPWRGLWSLQSRCDPHLIYRQRIRRTFRRIGGSITIWTIFSVTTRRHLRWLIETMYVRHGW